MGRRSGYPEGHRPGLAENDARNLRELLANLVNQGLACFCVRFAAALAFLKQGLDSGRRRADQPRRAVVEPPAFRFGRFVPSSRNLRIFVQVRGWAAAERIDEAQRMAHTR